jgi:hypothetical protein
MDDPVEEFLPPVLCKIVHAFNDLSAWKDRRFVIYNRHWMHAALSWSGFLIGNDNTLLTPTVVADWFQRFGPTSKEFMTSSEENGMWTCSMCSQVLKERDDWCCEERYISKQKDITKLQTVWRVPWDILLTDYVILLYGGTFK